LQTEWTEEAIQRLTTDNRTLDERLKAARSNLRFQDRRVADLEAQIASPGPDV
jgi:N-methylhydantoinase B/oxoprolinase/acetone carboxylase alpha subunit